MLSLTQRPIQTHKQTQELKHYIQQTIKGTIIKDHGICTECGYQLSDEEIKKGWSNNPLDIKTTCPKCQNQFVAMLRLENKESDNVVQINYLCMDQLMYGLKEIKLKLSRKVLGAKFLLHKYPELFWNIIRHFGTYELGLAAYKKS